MLGEPVHLGKETNQLEEVEQGLVHDWVQRVFREEHLIPRLSNRI